MPQKLCLNKIESKGYNYLCANIKGGLLEYQLNLQNKVDSQNLDNQQWWPFVHGLPKLIANISSQFQHLVNTVLAVSSLLKWIPIKVTVISKIGKISVV